MSTVGMFEIQPATVEQLFRRMIDGLGYHDAKSIPTEDVFRMFEAFFKYEHDRNTQLQKLLNGYNRLSLLPIRIENGSSHKQHPTEAA